MPTMIDDPILQLRLYPNFLEEDIRLNPQSLKELQPALNQPGVLERLFAYIINHRKSQMLEALWPFANQVQKNFVFSQIIWIEQINWAQRYIEDSDIDLSYSDYQPIVWACFRHFPQRFPHLMRLFLKKLSSHHDLTQHLIKIYLEDGLSQDFSEIDELGLMLAPFYQYQLCQIMDTDKIPQTYYHFESFCTKQQLQKELRCSLQKNQKNEENQKQSGRSKL